MIIDILMGSALFLMIIYFILAIKGLLYPKEDDLSCGETIDHTTSMAINIASIVINENEELKKQQQKMASTIMALNHKISELEQKKKHDGIGMTIPCDKNLN